MFYQERKQRMRAKQTKHLEMETNDWCWVAYSFPRQPKNNIFSTPRWSYPLSKHQWDTRRIKENKGHWQQ